MAKSRDEKNAPDREYLPLWKMVPLGGIAVLRCFGPRFFEKAAFCGGLREFLSDSDALPSGPGHPLAGNIPVRSRLMQIQERRHH